MKKCLRFVLATILLFGFSSNLTLVANEDELIEKFSEGEIFGSYLLTLSPAGKIQAWNLEKATMDIGFSEKLSQISIYSMAVEENILWGLSERRVWI